MAWIRLDDQIGHHPKFLKAGLSSWLWVCCIGFAQKFLTDGFVPSEAIASIAGGVERPQTHIDRLVKVGLLDKVKDGYQVHDYLTFNDSAAVVKRKREADRVRKDNARNPQVSVRPDSSDTRARDPIPSVAVASPSLELHSNNKLARAVGVSTPSVGTNGSKRPIYQSDRFVVFEWQLEKISRLLGPHIDAFELDVFFDQLTQDSRKNGLVIPQRDGGEWLMAQVLSEAKKRHLPIADAGGNSVHRESLESQVAGVREILKKQGAL